jgi:amino acid transporter
VVGIPAGIWDIDTFAELSNIGTLFAFVLVSLGVIVLRKKQPERPRSFRVPFVPLFPIISIVCCVALMMGLPLVTWIRFFVWLVYGLAVYFDFGWEMLGLNIGALGGFLLGRAGGDPRGTDPFRHVRDDVYWRCRRATTEFVLRFSRP